MTSPKKNLVHKPYRIPTMQDTWELDPLLHALEAYGIEACLRITRVANNEISINIMTPNTTKAQKLLTHTLHQLYGIKPS